MQIGTFDNRNAQGRHSVKSEIQIAPRRRDSIQHRAIFAAVREWEATIPGKAQEQISTLVAAKWAELGGRGISLNKQNLYRYLKNEGNSNKYTGYVMQLSEAIAEVMPIEIARKHGLRHGKTDTELVASAIKECGEAHQAKLLGAPLQRLEKEVREAATALISLLPTDVAGPLLASLSAVAPQFL